MAKSNMLPILLLGGAGVLAVVALGGARKRGGGGGASLSSGPRPNVKLVNGLPTEAQARAWAPAIVVGAQRAAPIEEITQVADSYPGATFYVFQNVAPSEGSEVKGQTLYPDGTFDVWGYSINGLSAQAAKLSSAIGKQGQQQPRPGPKPSNGSSAEPQNYMYLGTNVGNIDSIVNGRSMSVVVASDTPGVTRPLVLDMAKDNPDVFFIQTDCLPGGACGVTLGAVPSKGVAGFSKITGIDESSIRQALDFVRSSV